MMKVGPNERGTNDDPVGPYLHASDHLAILPLLGRILVVAVVLVLLLLLPPPRVLPFTVIVAVVVVVVIVVAVAGRNPHRR